MMNIDEIKELMKSSKKMKILYVEDNPETRESTLLVLREFFDTIYVGEDGEDGFEKFKEHKDEIDFVLTDINMPRLNGIEMSKKILQLREVSIVLLTAHNEIGFFQKSLEINADGYILKPFDIAQFTSLFKKIIKKIEISKQREEYLSLLRQYEDITNKSSIVSKTDPKGVITYVNDKFCEISGYTKEELLGKPHNIVRHPDMPKSAFKDMWDTIKSKRIWSGIVKNRTKRGNSYYVKATISPILDGDGNIKEYIAVRHDVGEIISEKKQLFDFLEINRFSVIVLVQIEDYDILEKFYDRATVEEIEDAFRKALIYLMPEKCNFKKVYKLGEGMFAFVQSRKICQDTKEELYKILEELQDNIKEYVVKLNNIEYDISAVSSYTFGVFNIFEDAKIGIEKAIKERKSIVYADGLAESEKEEARRNLQVIQIIKRAIESNKIVSYFQPIINNETMEIEKYESLVRLITENGEILSPFKFLDVARKGRYYQKITTITLENSFKALEITDKEISINLAAEDIESEEIKEIIYNLLDKYKKYSGRVVFELLESEDIRNFNLVKEFISDVKSKGVQIAIDDFGTGYSNFERLLMYEPDILKIDGSLTKNILDKKLSRDIVEVVISFAKKQNLKIVAEFVENQEIVDCIKRMGVEYSQGYFFGEPKPLVQR